MHISGVEDLGREDESLWNSEPDGCGEDKGGGTEEQRRYTTLGQ